PTGIASVQLPACPRVRKGNPESCPWFPACAPPHGSPPPPDYSTHVPIPRPWFQEKRAFRAGANIPPCCASGLKRNEKSGGPQSDKPPASARNSPGPAETIESAWTHAPSKSTGCPTTTSSPQNNFLLWSPPSGLSGDHRFA